jgi:ferritin-like metal-binding protein YciE
MSLAERKFMKALDEMILNASDSQLKKIQELDIETQMDGSNFYDVFSKHDKKSTVTSKTPSIKKQRK